MKQLYALLILTLSIVGCTSYNPKQLQYNDYVEWVSKNKESLSKVKDNRIISINAEFQPSDLLAYHEYKRSGKSDDSDYDVILEKYQCGISFKISVKAKDQQVNLLNYGISSYAEYSERINYLSFQIKEFTSITTNGYSYKPVLSHFEGYNEFSNRLIFHTVFQPEEFDCGKYRQDFGDIRLTFEDPFWGAGVNHFTFNKEQLINIPQLILAQN